MNLNIGSKGLVVISIFVGFYLLIALLAPVFMKYGYTNIGNVIYEVYEKFCHQRVERSLFLFGEKGFYTVLELKEDGVLPLESGSDKYPEYFGHGYVGNEEIGYKVAVCIRDIALYLSFMIAGLVIGLKKSVNIRWRWIMILLIPIFLDIGVQMVFEQLRFEGAYLQYVNDISKRIFTGILAGVGMALLLRKIFENSLTNKD